LSGVRFPLSKNEWARRKEKRFRRRSKYKTRESQLSARRLGMSLGETEGVLYGNVEYEGYQRGEVERRF
jgi:hypothetical protein